MWKEWIYSVCGKTFWLSEICSSVVPERLKKAEQVWGRKGLQGVLIPSVPLGTEVTRKWNSFPISQHTAPATKAIKGEGRTWLVAAVNFNTKKVKLGNGLLESHDKKYQLSTV